MFYEGAEQAKVFLDEPGRTKSGCVK